MFMTLEIELDGPVSTIWMNRPELHNAFDENLIARADRHLRRPRPTTTTSASSSSPAAASSFSAGADLNWMKRAADNGIDDNSNDARALANMLRTLAR